MKIKRIIFLFILLIATVIGAFFLWHKVQIAMAKDDIRTAFVPFEPSKGLDFNYSEFKVLDSLFAAPDKTIIAFGEATHGTNEFQTAFIQLAKYLITGNRINMVVLAERNFADSWPLNDFVLGKSDSVSVETVFPYSSKYERELLEWIRQFNKGKSEEEKIWVAGTDFYHPRFAAINAVELLKADSISVSNETMAVLNDWAMSPMAFELFLSKSEEGNPYSELDSLYRILVQKVADDGTVKEKWMVQSVKSLSQGISTIRHDRIQSGLRDSIMFDNLEWLMSMREEPSMLIFGHNAHIEKHANNTLSVNNARLGWLINEKYPSNYFTIATEVQEGSYRSGKRHSFNIPESFMKIGSIIGGSVREGSGFIDLHKSKDVEEFFNKKWYMTYGVLDTDSPTYPVSDRFSDAFDLVYWVRSSTPLEVSGTDFYNIVTRYNKPDNPEVFADTISAQVQVDFSMFPSGSEIYEFPTVGMMLYSGKHYLGHDSQRVLSSGAVNLSYNNAENKVDSVVVYMYGNRAQSFALEELTINGRAETKEKILFNGSNYEVVEKPSELVSLKLK